MEPVISERLDDEMKEAERHALRDRIREASAALGSYVAACPEARQFTRIGEARSRFGRRPRGPGGGGGF